MITNIDTNEATSTAPEKSPKYVWEEKTHKKIIEKAVELMRAYARNGSNANVGAFVSTFFDNNEFKNCLIKGLRDADEEAPWNEDYWLSHFYNPKNEQNYKADKKITARSEARRYFKLSEHYGQRILYFLSRSKKPGAQLYKNAGYYLGLSLHFFTDLTQPMHAANFTSFWGYEGTKVPYYGDFRHSGFEVYTDDAVERGLLNDLEPLADKHLEPVTNDDVGAYIKSIAERSFKIFEKEFRPVLDKKVFVKYAGVNWVAKSYWASDEADPLIKITTRLAPYDVANYLTNWMRLSKIMPDLNSDKWYQFKEPTEAKVADVSHGSSAWVARYAPHEGWNQQFYLLFNADGTVCIGCRQGKDRLWFVATGYTPAWIGMGTKIERATKFRIIQFSDVQPVKRMFSNQPKTKLCM